MDGTAQEAGGTHEGHPYYYYARGESRGAQPLCGVWGCPPVQRGTASLAGVWGCPPEIFISATTLPGGVPQRKCGGGQGGSGGVPHGPSTASLAGVWGCPPEIHFCYYVRGESRGAQPLWQGSGGVPQRSFLLLPGGVQRGTASLAGVWGCPPEIFYFCPLPSRKGARGMVRATIETTRSEAEVPHATPPQIATSQPPRNDGGWWHGGDLTSVMACPTLASTKAVKGFIRLQDLAEKRLQMCSEPWQIRRTPDGLCSSNQRSAPALAF